MIGNVMKGKESKQTLIVIQIKIAAITPLQANTNEFS